MSDILADVTRLMRELEARFPQPPFDTIVAKPGALIYVEHKVGRTLLGGVRLIERDSVPADKALLMRDGKIVGILELGVEVP